MHFNGATSGSGKRSRELNTVGRYTERHARMDPVTGTVREHQRQIGHELFPDQQCGKKRIANNFSKNPYGKNQCEKN